MVTKLQLKITEDLHSANEYSMFEEGKVYPATCQGNLLMIDCEGVVVMECLSEETRRKFDIVSIDEEVSGKLLMVDELYNFTRSDNEGATFPKLVLC